MKRLTYWFLLLAASIFFVSCSNNSTTSPVGPQTDSDTLATTEEGEFVTAGSKKGENSYTSGDQNEAPDAGAEDDKGGNDATREIVEADIYKVEGNILWVLNQYRGLAAIDITNPNKLSILGRVSFKGFPFEMYVQEGRAYVMVNGLKYNPEEKEEGYAQSHTMSELIIIDVADTKKMSILGRMMLEGDIVDSRQVGDVIYVAASEHEYTWYYCNSSEKRGQNQLTIASLNIADPTHIQEIDRISIAGTGHALYVTDHSIYLSEYFYDYNGAPADGYPVHYFDISDPAGSIVEKGIFKTKGYIGDRWKMHEKEGVFFAVTTDGQWSNGTSMVEAFSIADPEKITKISEFAFMYNQQLYGARFEGNRLYAVTYFRQDPLHVIDITDAKNMKELGQLQVPGWSTHLEIRGDKILTVGIDDQDGWAAKVSMYDVADPKNPKEMNTVKLGGTENGYSWSEATNDWKAFKIYDNLGLILVPTAAYNYENYQEINRLHLIDFDLEKGLTARGSIEAPSYVKRGVVIGSFIASVGEKEVMTIDYADRDNPKILATLTVARTVDNLMHCGGLVCGITGNFYGSEGIKLARYDVANTEDPAVWQSNKIGGRYVTNQKNFDDVGYIFTYDYTYKNDESGRSEYTEKSLLTKFAYSATENPVSKGFAKLEAPVIDSQSPSYYYWNSRYSATNAGAVAMLTFKYDYFCMDDAGGYIEDCNDYNNYYNKMDSHIAVYDARGTISGTLKPVLIDKTFRTLSYRAELIANGNQLWFTDCKPHGIDSEKRELLLCYAQSVDVTNPAKPVLGEKYSIPGELIGMSNDGTLFYTLNQAWVSYEANGKYSSKYVYHLVILKKTAGEQKLSVVKVIPWVETYESTPKHYESSWTNMVPQDKRIYLNTIKQEFTYNESDSCGYYWYGNTERSSSLKLINAENGTVLFDEVIPDGVGMNMVDGGGVLIPLQPNNDYYYYYYSSASNEYLYVSPDGKKQDIVLSDATYYNDYYSYYSASNAILKGQTLYIARGYEGIVPVTVK